MIQVRVKPIATAQFSWRDEHIKKVNTGITRII